MLQVFPSSRAPVRRSRAWVSGALGTGASMVAVGSSRTSGARRRAIINTLARQQGLAEQTPGCRRHRQQHLHAAASSSSSNGGSATRAKEAEGIHASRSGAAHGTLPLHTATQPYTHTSRHGKGGPSIAGHEVAQRERKRPRHTCLAQRRRLGGHRRRRAEAGMLQHSTIPTSTFDTSRRALHGQSWRAGRDNLSLREECMLLHAPSPVAGHAFRC